MAKCGQMKTVGVRILLIKDQKILLVKHKNRGFWYMPGGGVEAGESPIEAAKRELFEEVNVVCDKFELFGLYYSLQNSCDDYCAVYAGFNASFDHLKIDNVEIAEANFFSFDDLPQDVSPGTKRRIEEYLGLKEKSDVW